MTIATACEPGPVEGLDVEPRRAAMTRPNQPESGRASDISALWQELLYLRSWPDIRSVPDVCIGALVRVCALLSHKQTVGFLVPRALGLEADEAKAILWALYRAGHLGTAGQKDAGAAISARAPSAAAEGEASFLRALCKSLLSF